MTRETILLVEDEHDIRELLKFHLERDNLAGFGEGARLMLETPRYVLQF